MTAIRSSPRRFMRMLLFAAMLSFAAGCGVPNLDPPECSASRLVVREFYSYHFGNEMKFSAQGLKDRQRFLSPELIEKVSAAPEGTDPFTTGTSDLPKAFRAGKCKVVSPDRTRFDLIIFWKDDARSEQRTLKVEALKAGDGWLVDKIER